MPFPPDGPNNSFSGVHEIPDLHENDETGGGGDLWGDGDYKTPEELMDRYIDSKDLNDDNGNNKMLLIIGLLVAFYSGIF